MRALFVTVALALAMLGQLSSLVHWWAVQHDICAEHGQLVDENGEHCTAGLTPAEPFEPAALEVAQACLAAPLACQAQAETLTRTRAVLRFAPKTSPPVV